MIMQALRNGALLTILLCVSGTAFARAGVPIVNFDNNPIIAPGGRELTLDDVEEAIRAAGASQGYPWVVSESVPGRLKLSTLVRNKHTVVVDVVYDTRTYAIRYANSVNMNYKNRKGQELIHPNYNVWVRDLKQAIDAQLLADSAGDQ